MSHISQVYFPQTIPFTKIKSITHFATFSYILLSNHQILSYSNNSNYELPLTSSIPHIIKDVFYTIPLPQINILHSIDSSLFIITNDYNVYTIHSNKLTEPPEIDGTLSKIKITNIVSSHNQSITIILNNKHQCYLYGTFPPSNKYIQHKQLMLLQHIPNEFNYINNIGCSDKYIVIQDFSGIIGKSIYISHSHNNGKKNDSYEIIKVPFDYMNEQVSKFECGDDVLCLLDRKGCVYLYNENEGIFKVKLHDSIVHIMIKKKYIFLINSTLNTYHILTMHSHKGEIIKNINENVYGLYSKYFYISQIITESNLNKELLFTVETTSDNIKKAQDNQIKMFSLRYVSDFKNKTDENGANILIVASVNQIDPNVSMNMSLYSNYSTNSIFNKTIENNTSIIGNNKLNGRIAKITSLLGKIFDTKLDEVEQRRARSSKKTIQIEKVNSSDYSISLFTHENLGKQIKDKLCSLENENDEQCSYNDEPYVSGLYGKNHFTYQNKTNMKRNKSSGYMKLTKKLQSITEEEDKLTQQQQLQYRNNVSSTLSSSIMFNKSNLMLNSSCNINNLTNSVNKEVHFIKESMVSPSNVIDFNKERKGIASVKIKSIKKKISEKEITFIFDNVNVCNHNKEIFNVNPIIKKINEFKIQQEQKRIEIENQRIKQLELERKLHELELQKKEQDEIERQNNRKQEQREKLLNDSKYLQQFTSKNNTSLTKSSESKKSKSNHIGNNSNLTQSVTNSISSFLSPSSSPKKKSLILSPEKPFTNLRRAQTPSKSNCSSNKKGSENNVNYNNSSSNKAYVYRKAKVVNCKSNNVKEMSYNVKKVNNNSSNNNKVDNNKIQHVESPLLLKLKQSNQNAIIINATSKESLVELIQKAKEKIKNINNNNNNSIYFYLEDDPSKILKFKDNNIEIINQDNISSYLNKNSSTIQTNPFNASITQNTFSFNKSFNNKPLLNSKSQKGFSELKSSSQNNQINIIGLTEHQQQQPNSTQQTLTNTTSIHNPKRNNPIRLISQAKSLSIIQHSNSNSNPHHQHCITSTSETQTHPSQLFYKIQQLPQNQMNISTNHNTNVLNHYRSKSTLNNKPQINNSQHLIKKKPHHQHNNNQPIRATTPLNFISHHSSSNYQLPINYEECFNANNSSSKKKLNRRNHSNNHNSNSNNNRKISTGNSNKDVLVKKAVEQLKQRYLAYLQKIYGKTDKNDINSICPPSNNENNLIREFMNSEIKMNTTDSEYLKPCESFLSQDEMESFFFENLKFDKLKDKLIKNKKQQPLKELSIATNSQQMLSLEEEEKNCSLEPMELEKSSFTKPSRSYNFP